MDWIIPVSSQERAQGRLSPAANAAASRSMTAHGFAVLRGAFDVGAVDAMYSEFNTQFGACDLAAMKELAGKPSAVTEVGGSRFEIVVRLMGAFNAGIFANPLLTGFLQPLLGEMRLSGVTAVASYPGAELQRMHRDYLHLFVDYNVGPLLPAYAVNVSVPLIDVSLDIGPTAIWPGSHRLAIPAAEAQPVSFAFQRGDAVMIDYRTAHAGLPNTSATVRPILYMVYARPWFFDDSNHPQRAPLNMSLEDFYALPEDVKPLLMRAYSYQMRARLIAGQA